MPHHRHPDEGDVPFTELEFDDQIDESFENGIEVTIQAEDAAGTALPAGHATIQPGQSTWMPAENVNAQGQPDPLNWQDVTKLEVSLSARLDGQDLTGSVTLDAGAQNMMTSAHCSLLNVNPGALELTGSGLQGVHVGTGQGWFPEATQLMSISFTNQHPATIYAYVKAKDVEGVSAAPVPISIPPGGSETGLSGAIGLVNVTTLDIALYADPGRTQGVGGVEAEVVYPAAAIATAHCGLTEPGPDNAQLSVKNILGQGLGIAGGIGQFSPPSS